MNLWIDTNITDHEHSLVYGEFTRNREINTRHKYRVPEEDVIVELLDNCAVERRWENGTSYREFVFEMRWCIKTSYDID